VHKNPKVKILIYILKKIINLLSFCCFLLDFLIKISYILVYQERDLYLSMIKIKQVFKRIYKEKQNGKFKHNEYK